MTLTFIFAGLELQKVSFYEVLFLIFKPCGFFKNVQAT